MNADKAAVTATHIRLGVFAAILAVACGGGGGGGGSAFPSASRLYNGSYGGTVLIQSGSPPATRSEALLFTLTRSGTSLHGSLMLTPNIVANVSGRVDGGIANLASSFSSDTDLGPCPTSVSITLERQTNGIIQVLGNGNDCEGPYLLESQASRLLGTDACEDIADNWQGIETGTITITVDGDTEVEPFTANGTITIDQAACEASYVIPGTSIERSGSVSENLVTFESPLIIPAPGVTVTENTFTITGVLETNGDHLTMTGVGIARGSLDDLSFTVRASTSATLDRLPQVTEVELIAMSFIPGNAAVPPANVGNPGCIVNNLDRGDDRQLPNGGALFSPTSTRFRSRHTAHIFKSAAPVDAKAAGASREYHCDALADDGALSDADNDDVGDCELLTRTAVASTTGMQFIPTQLGLRHTVHIFGDIANPLAFGSGLADITWDYNIILDFTNARTMFVFSGKHNSFPAHELYVNRRPVVRFDPGPPDGTVNSCDFVQLSPPVPVYSFGQIAVGLNVTTRATSLAGVVPPTPTAASRIPIDIAPIRSSEPLALGVVGARPIRKVSR